MSAASSRPSHDGGAATGDRRVAIWLAITAFAFLALVAPGYVDNMDSQIQFTTAERLLDAGTTSLRGTEWGEHRYAIVAPDGASYMPYGPGATLLYLPAILIGRGLHGALGMNAQKAAAFFCTFTSPVAAAATLALLFLAMRRLRRSVGESLAVCALCGLGTYVLAYARSTYYETSMALAVFAAFHLLVRAGSTTRDALLAGVAFAVAASMKIANVVVVPAFVALLLVDGGPARMRRFVAFFVPLGVLGAALLWWNYARFGSPFVTGYGRFATFGTPLLEGLTRLTIGGAGGWFVFSPVLLLAVPGMFLLAREDKRTAWFVGLAFLAVMLLAAKYSFPEGGTAYGPRYLVPVTAIAAIPAGLAFAKSRGAARVACAALLVVSVAVQIPTLVLAHQDYWQIADAHAPEDRGRVPPPVLADFVLAREKVLGRDDPWDLSCLGVAPSGTKFRSVYPALPGVNVWWIRAARNYGRPWAMLGAIPLAALCAFAALRLRGAVRDVDGRRDVVAA
jgi:hypothetical protein